MSKPIIADRDVGYIVASSIRVDSQLTVQISSPFGFVLNPAVPDGVLTDGEMETPENAPNESMPYSRESFLEAIDKML